MSHTPSAWLSAAEQAEYAALRAPRRRQDWLAGRWVAKRLVRAACPGARGLPLAAIQLSPARGEPPRACWPGCPQGWRLSLSHCDGFAAAALAADPWAAVGIDVERVAARPAGFAEEYFTAGERRGLGPGVAAEAGRMTAIWSAKEAALKALGLGLTVDTRAVEVRLGGEADNGWRRLALAADPMRLPPAARRAADALQGWWRFQGPFVLAIAVVENANQNGVARAPFPDRRPSDPVLT